MKRMIWLGLPVIALTGCAGPGYVHETYHDDYYYGSRPYYGQDVYIQRETYYEPRPRVMVVDQPRTIVVREPEQPHRHVEQYRVEQHRGFEDRRAPQPTYRQEQRYDHREDAPQRRDVAVKPIRVEQREQARQPDPGQRLGAPTPVSQDKQRRDNRQSRDEEREQRPR